MPPQKPLTTPTRDVSLSAGFTRTTVTELRYAWNLSMDLGLGGCRLLVVVAIKQLYLGHARQVGHAAYSVLSPVIWKIRSGRRR